MVSSRAKRNVLFLYFMDVFLEAQILEYNSETDFI